MRGKPRTSLNPYFNGILKYSRLQLCTMGTRCLNPCFNGILKYIEGLNASIVVDNVLILVLMEY